MKIIINIFFLLLFQSSVYAGAYLDAYTIEVQLEIQKIEIKIQNNNASTIEKKRRDYLIKRLNNLKKQK